MNIFLIIVFLATNIFTCQLIAKEHKYAPEKSKKLEKASGKEKLEELDVSVTQPENVHIGEIRRRYHYPYLQSITVRAGGNIETNEDSNSFFLFGGAYMFPNRKSPHWEFGADLIAHSSGVIYAAKKYIQNPQHTFRTNYKYGLSHQFATDEGLASFVNYKNYQLLGGIGLEYLIILPTSLRLDIELHLGIGNIIGSALLGVSWGW